MTHNVDIAATIEEINEARNTAMLTLGARYRVEVLLPLCKLHCLTYTSGMGMLWFGNIDEYNSVFGYYVADINEEEVVS